MQHLFDNWKYIMKNIWFVLPFSVMPAVFMALSLDFTAIRTFATGFFSGDPRLGFADYFGALSFVRFDSWLGGIYSVLAFLFLAVCSALMLAFVEKHMRIGKRSFSGILSGFLNIFPSALAVTFLYTFIFEAWALLLSALLFVIAEFESSVAVYILMTVAGLVFVFALLYVATVFYLWLPCRQMTGFGPYNAFLYSYRLVMGVRWRLVLSYSITYLCVLLVVAATCFLPESVFRIVAVIEY